MSNITFLVIVKAKLLCSQGKYKEVLILLQENSEHFEKRNVKISGILLFIKKKLNLLTKEDELQYSYLFRQIINYQEELALCHVKNYVNCEEDSEILRFEDDFPIDDIYYQLRRLLPLSNLKINHDVIADMYIFKLDNNGRAYGKLVDYLKVITLKDSNDIITMYPYDNLARLPYYDLTSSLKESETCKAKRMSQIDKFNQRYGK